MSIARYLRWFNKEGDAFIGELVIECSLQILQRIFNVGAENPMYDCWKVTEKEVTELSNIINYQFDIQQFDYYIEADSESTEMN